jgi:large subunit ribosomal protein L15
MSNGVREKALQFLREVPRLSQSNIQRLPGTSRPTKRQYGQKGKERGWGASARQKMHFAPLGYESGSTPIQRKTSFERSYNYGIHTTRQFPPLTLHQLQLAIDTNRLDVSKPIDMGALCGTGVFFLNPEKNHFGFNLTSEGMDLFKAKINIEVQWADEQTIAAVERNGGRITTAYYDLHSVLALSDPIRFFKTGVPIPRRLTPPGNLLQFYSEPRNRGYLADPALVEEDREVLAQKYGYTLPENQDENIFNFNKDPRQIFYGLEPGWLISLQDRTIFKPNQPDLKDVYSS